MNESQEFTVGRISKPIFNDRMYWRVSGRILFFREPIPKTKISIRRKFTYFEEKSKTTKSLPGRG